jgi:hypothetical protein
MIIKKYETSLYVIVSISLLRSFDLIFSSGRSRNVFTIALHHFLMMPVPYIHALLCILWFNVNTLCPLLLLCLHATLKWWQHALNRFHSHNEACYEEVIGHSMSQKSPNTKLKGTGKHFFSVKRKFQFAVPSDSIGLLSSQVGGLAQYLHIRYFLVNCVCVCNKHHTVFNGAACFIVEYYFRAHSHEAVNPLKPKLAYIIFKNSIRTSKWTPHFTVTKVTGQCCLRK